MARELFENLLFSCDSNVPEYHQCEKCDFKTHLKVILNNHVNVTHKNSKADKNLRCILESYLCRNCCFETSSMLVLSKHVRFQNVDDLLYSTRDNFNEYIKPLKLINKKAKETSFDDCEQFRCTLCPYVTKWKYCTDRHRKANSKLKISGWFKCECSFRTPSKQELAVHKDYNKSMYPLKCKRCSYKTILKCALKKHMTVDHLLEREVKWYKCGQCSHKSPWESNIKRHMMRIHEIGDPLRY